MRDWRAQMTHRVGKQALTMALAATTLLVAIGGMGIETAWAQQQPRPPAPPRRQPPARRTPPKWTLEIHGGGLFGSGRPGGTSTATFPVGASFATIAGQPSRAVPSWFFGDGATLFSQVQAQFDSQFNQRFDRITPLDVALQRAGTERQIAPGFGVRLSRVVSPRYSIEFDIDWSQRALALTSDTADAIEQTRTTFSSAFTGLVNTIPQTGLRVGASADIPESGGGQTSLTGALLISLAKRGRFGVHAIAGGGLVVSGSRTLDVTMRGTYAFNIFGTFPINESDTVTIHFADRKTSGVAVFGGGFTYGSPRRGLRTDVRALAGSSGVTTSVDASPNVQRVVPASVLPSLTSPSIQVSTTTGVPTSLSGSAISRLETFAGSGLDLRVQLTVGYFFRF
jgi:hypothetical protein